MAKIGRNDPCPCGSGYKAKNCCLAGGPDDAAYIMATQESPMAKLAARWLSAARRRYDRGQQPDETMERRAEQFLRVCRGWNPDAYDAAGNPGGDLAHLAVAFNGRAAAVFGALAVGLAHLLLGQPDAARPWLAALAAPHEDEILSYIAAAGLPTAPFAGLADLFLALVDHRQAESV